MWFSVLKKFKIYSKEKFIFYKFQIINFYYSPKMDTKSHFLKIYKKLQEKYKIGPKKIDFKNEKIFDQIKYLIKKIKSKGIREKEIMDDESSEYVDKLLPLDGIESNSDSSTDSSEESTEEIKDISSDYDKNYETAADALKILEKPVNELEEFEDEICSDYLEDAAV